MAVTELQRQQGGEMGCTVAATGGLLGSILAGLVAASCCLLPLAIISLGIGGSLLALLDSLAPYQPYLLGGAGLSLAYGFWRAYRQGDDCAAGLPCATTQSRRRTTAALWTGVAVFAAAIVLQAYGPLLTAYLV